MKNAESRLRVALVTPVLWPYVLSGGINAYVATLAKQLHGVGHSVTVVGREIHAHAVESETEYAEPWGKSVSVVPFTGPGVGERFANLRAALAVGRYLKRHEREFDVVETTNWLGHGAFCSMASIPSVSRLSTPANEYLDASFGVRHLTWLEGRSCRLADVVIGHSQAILDKAAPLYRMKDRRTFVVPLGVEDAIGGPIARSEEYVDFLCVGRSEDHKGTDVLLRAALAAFERSPTIRLTLVGSDVASYVSSRAASAGAWAELLSRFGERIRELGTVDDVRKLEEYARAHYVLVPSRFESFGLVVAEAMRAGTPVIAAAGGSLADVCSYGPENFVYGDPEDADALTSAMLDAGRRGPAEADSRRAATRIAFERFFTVDRFVEATIGCYREAITSRARESLPVHSQQRHGVG